MSEPMTADKMLPTYTDEQGSYLAHEVSHDLRAGLPDRERWNNRCVGMLLNEIERLRSEVSRLSSELATAKAGEACRTGTPTKPAASSRASCQT